MVLLRITFKLSAENPVYLRNFIVWDGCLSKGFVTAWRESLRRLAVQGGAGFSRVRGQRGTRDVLLPWNQKNSESLGTLYEHNELAIRSPNSYNHPMHMRLQDQGL